MARLRQSNDPSQSIHCFYESKKTYTQEQKILMRNFGEASVKHLQKRNFKILSEGLEPPLDDSLQKYNPDSELLLYNLAQERRQKEVEDGFYFKVKQGMMDNMNKFAMKGG